MKKTPLAIGAAVLAMVLFFGWNKVATWIGVAKDSLSARIDETLGKYAVERKAIDRKMSTLKEAADRLLVSEKTAEAKLARLSDELDQAQTKLQRVESVRQKITGPHAKEILTKLEQKGIEKTEARSITRELDSLSQRLKAKVNTYQKRREVLTNCVSKLRATRRRAQAMLSSMQQKIELIDDKLAALRDMKQVVSLSTRSPDSIAADLDSLERDLNELTDRVSGELAAEEEKWKMSTPIEELVDSTNDASVGGGEAGGGRQDLSSVLEDVLR